MTDQKLVCSERYYPPWSSRGIRSVDCRHPAKKMLYTKRDGTHRPVCGIHARVYMQESNYVIEELEGAAT